MNLGLIEEHLLRALAPRFGKSVTLLNGPAFASAATGVRAEVFIHAARFTDRGGVSDEGARIARKPLMLSAGIRGFLEQRPASIEIDLVAVCATHSQAQALSGLISMEAMEALERLEAPLLSDPTDPLRRIRFINHQTHIHAVGSCRIEYEGAPAAQTTSTLRLDGFLEIRLARKGGLEQHSAYDVSLEIRLHANSKSKDQTREYVEFANKSGAPINLGGWTLQDSARRPHRFVFPVSYQLPAGATLRLWSGRGINDTGNLFWGRRKAVWNNKGDQAILLDPEGVERARSASA